MKIFSLLIVLFLFINIPIYSQNTINIPADYPTIQQGINAASNGDLVLVADGTYYENINFMGKAITVASNFYINGNESHIQNTIIDGSQPSSSDTASVVVFINGEDTSSVLCGFTITGGTGTIIPQYPAWNRAGGGIFINAAGGKIINNIITANSAIQNISGQYYVGGGGINAISSLSGINLIIKDNIISNNTITGEYYSIGAGIAVWPGTYTLIENNIIQNNVASSLYVEGGGIFISTGPAGIPPQIINNFISDNSALSTGSNSAGGGGGIYTINNSALLQNNLIVNNQGTQGGGIKIYTNVESDLELSACFIPDLLTQLPDITFEPILENNTICNNTAPGYGGGIRNFNTTTEIVNTIVWGNDGSGNEDQISGSQVTVSYSNVEGGYTGNGNINLDPLFNLSSEYWLLNNNSPCIDAGNPDPMYNDVEDLQNPGNPMWPALGGLTNDIGHFGGPSSVWCYWNWPVPVELISFTASLRESVVILNWSTLTETNNSGFEIERKLTGNDWERIGFVEGHGTTTEPVEYTFRDFINGFNSNVISYRLKQIDYDGSYEYSNVVSVENITPIDYSLQQNFPNPFNPSTKIKYSIPQQSSVVIKVFDILGNQIETLVNEEKPAGIYELTWYAEALPSGVYFYRLQAGDFVETKKMVLMK